jgi:CMP-N,N'-diacetyllegionaminic acid synthase
MKVWGLIPARGGSKSIPRKNLVPLGGRPLLDYGALAARASKCLERIYCSTDDREIAARAQALDIEVTWRPAQLASDEARVDEVGRDFLAGFAPADRPDCLVLVQPTSPFLLPRHVSELVDAMASRPSAASIHNVTPVSHNLHAWNQRELAADGSIRFLFAEQRRVARNKQEKPSLYGFGNLIAARTNALLEGRGFYAEPVSAVPIEAPWNFDLDSFEDLRVAEALLAAGLVALPHINS